MARPATLRPVGSSLASRSRRAVSSKRARIEIEHRLGIGLIAGARIVAAQHQQIAHADRRRAQQVALQRDAVAVAAGELEDRLDPCSTSSRRRGHRAEMRPRAGAVGDVDGVGQALERQRLGEQFVAVGGHRRRHFRGEHKAPGAQIVLETSLRR